jgi:serine protease AprX
MRVFIIATTVIPDRARMKWPLALWRKATPPGGTAGSSAYYPRMLGSESVLAIHERLDVHRDYAGAGITIAFVDSAFFPHPDLIRPHDRIRAFVDVGREAPQPEDFLAVDAHVWHGTMTSCCAAGSGYLSQGRYRGIAHEARLVLLKVQDVPHRSISGRRVAEALRFVLHHPELEVRIVNVSVGVSWDDPAALEVEAVAQELVAKGIVVVAAAGNIENAPPLPPASVADVIVVGGIDDGNSFLFADDTRWPSSSGARPSRVPKPDLLAPATGLPAPMVPATLTAREAPHLFHLLRILEEAEAEIRFRRGRALDLEVSSEASLSRMIEATRQRIIEQKFISPSYQHVDGTSFAAPITTSVVAQMLEANPTLTPALVRRGLTETARLLPDVAAALQGSGVLQPRMAVEWAIAQRSSNAD